MPAMCYSNPDLLVFYADFFLASFLALNYLPIVEVGFKRTC